MGKMALLVLALGGLALSDVAGGSAARAAPVVRPSLGARPVTGWVGARRFGPYATLRRANEVAAYYRVRGYRARVVSLGSLFLGTRSYAVNVWW